MQNELYITGIPNTVPEVQAGVLRTRLLKLIGDLLEKNNVQEINITISTSEEVQIVGTSKVPKTSTTESPVNFTDQTENQPIPCHIQKPLYSFNQLILPNEVKENLLYTVEAINVEEVVFDSWGLREIQPHPCTVLNFYGPPGTGKTLAAHAVADYMSKPILLATYADIESKFHGEGPKNLKSIFNISEKERAVLFIDEADSLLSRRLTEVNSGSEQAINSMRSQLLICLEQFRGVVIFATNLIENYDKAFETRVKHIEFLLPGIKEREKIWQCHIPDLLPTDQLDFNQLAQVDEVCGRDIREAVIDAANRAALRAKKEGKHPIQGQVSTNDLLEAIQRKKDERINDNKNNDFKDLEIKEKIEKQIRINSLNTK